TRLPNGSSGIRPRLPDPFQFNTNKRDREGKKNLIRPGQGERERRAERGRRWGRRREAGLRRGSSGGCRRSPQGSSARSAPPSGSASAAALAPESASSAVKPSSSSSPFLYSSTFVLCSFLACSLFPRYPALLTGCLIRRIVLLERHMLPCPAFCLVG
uniref:Uncharacterized protein n=1 Tax=Aegilops tauschii subsp. strangulata TaxID=200361 RepID=A0A453HH33_AEGTS